MSDTSDAVFKKLHDGLTAIEAKLRTAESRAKLERHMRGARHEAEAKVAEWKADREVEQLEAAAARADANDARRAREGAA